MIIALLWITASLSATETDLVEKLVAQTLVKQGAVICAQVMQQMNDAFNALATSSMADARAIITAKLTMQRVQNIGQSMQGFFNQRITPRALPFENDTSEQGKDIARQKKALDTLVAQCDALTKRAADTIVQLDKQLEAMYGTSQQAFLKMFKEVAEKIRAGVFQKRVSALSEQFEANTEDLKRIQSLNFATLSDDVRTETRTSLFNYLYSLQRMKKELDLMIAAVKTLDVTELLAKIDARVTEVTDLNKKIDQYISTTQQGLALFTIVRNMSVLFETRYNDLQREVEERGRQLDALAEFFAQKSLPPIDKTRESVLTLFNFAAILESNGFECESTKTVLTTIKTAVQEVQNTSQQLYDVSFEEPYAQIATLATQVDAAIILCNAQLQRVQGMKDSSVSFAGQVHTRNEKLAVYTDIRNAVFIQAENAGQAFQDRTIYLDTAERTIKNKAATDELFWKEFIQTEYALSGAIALIDLSLAQLQNLASKIPDLGASDFAVDTAQIVAVQVTGKALLDRIIAIENLVPKKSVAAAQKSGKKPVPSQKSAK